jgi:hypothetical protein
LVKGSYVDFSPNFNVEVWWVVPKSESQHGDVTKLWCQSLVMDAV